MAENIESDRKQRREEMSNFEQKMITFFTTFNPAPSPWTAEVQRPNTRAFIKQSQVPPNPPAQPKLTQEEYLIEGGYQVVKRGRHSPELSQGIDKPTKYQCTDDNSQTPLSQPPHSQEDQEHHLLGGAQI